MRLLADENVPGVVVSALRTRGHDVFWIAEELASVSDTRVLEVAQAESRLLLTFDTDFGALAFQAELQASAGIMLFRVPAPSPFAIATLVVATVESRDDWAGSFTVVEPGRTRMKRLPETPTGR